MSFRSIPTQFRTIVGHQLSSYVYFGKNSLDIWFLETKTRLSLTLFEVVFHMATSQSTLTRDRRINRTALNIKERFVGRIEGEEFQEGQQEKREFSGANFKD
jgi:hypothetical protein